MVTFHTDRQPRYHAPPMTALRPEALRRRLSTVLPLRTVIPRRRHPSHARSGVLAVICMGVRAVSLCPESARTNFDAWGPAR